MRLKDDTITQRAYQILKVMLDDGIPIDRAMDKVYDRDRQGINITFPDEVNARNRAVMAAFILNGEQ